MRQIEFFYAFPISQLAEFAYSPSIIPVFAANSVCFISIYAPDSYMHLITQSKFSIYINNIPTRWTREDISPYGPRHSSALHLFHDKETNQRRYASHHRQGRARDEHCAAIKISMGQKYCRILVYCIQL